MWDLGFLMAETPIGPSGRDDLHIRGTSAMRGLGCLIKETPIALSGRMVRTAEALVLCGIWVISLTKHPLR